MPSFSFKKMAKYWIDFASINVEASNSDEAYQKARALLCDGEVEIDQIVEDDR